MHHNHYFITSPLKHYIDKLVGVFNLVNPNQLSSMKLVNYIRQGTKKHKALWFKILKLSLNKGLRPIKRDNDIHQLCIVAKGYSNIKVYVGHEMNYPIMKDQIHVISRDR